MACAATFSDGRALRRAVELQMAEGYAEALDRLGGILDGLPTQQTDAPSTRGETVVSELRSITSADGTTIAYEKTGTGPATIVIPNGGPGVLR